MRSDLPTSNPRPRSGRSSGSDVIAAERELLARRSQALERLRPALRGLAEELAQERQRSAVLRQELNRVRRDLAVALDQRSA
ncbi:MAG: hypothetical protein GEU88_18595 [Solirubrobacterales bacterium]|nr:hypothetical protein [Solirubrobacterales bacterium]